MQALRRVLRREDESNTIPVFPSSRENGHVTHKGRDYCKRTSGISVHSKNQETNRKGLFLAEASKKIFRKKTDFDLCTDRYEDGQEGKWEKGAVTGVEGTGQGTVTAMSFKTRHESLVKRDQIT